MQFIRNVLGIKSGDAYPVWKLHYNRYRFYYSQCISHKVEYDNVGVEVFETFCMFSLCCVLHVILTVILKHFVQISAGLW